MASTIQDVARLSGLALGTVSKYINGKPVKEVNRLKIEQAIKELDYKPNNLAKGLRTAKTFTIAVLVPKLSNIHCTVIIAALEHYLLPKGYCVIVSECHDNADVEVKKTEFLLNRLVDGMIILPYSMNGKIVDMVKERNIPLVLIDQYIEDHPTDCVILDNAESTYRATQTLISMGHKKIALLTGSPSLFTAKGRIEGYRRALEESGLPVQEDLIINGNYTMDGGFSSVITLFKKQLLPPALIASNYDMTIGAFQAINTLKLKVPDDISIVGYDNLPLSQVVTPPLSIIEQPMEEMGYQAAELLYKRMQGDYSDYPKSIVNHASITISESVKYI